MQLRELYNCFLKCNIVTTDSREVTFWVEHEAKVMFFALRGENFDGNKFAIASLEAGAAYAVVDDPSLAPTEGLIFVENVLDAMTQLAMHHRHQLSHPHFAITGSNGKTTTKELMHAVLNKKYDCYATHGNLNNHIGVPLTILRTPASANFSIIELGANHRGEIAHLAAIAAPAYGLITNIGRAHLEGFGGEKGVKLGKGELFDYLEQHCGLAFYLSESEPLCELIEEHPSLKNESYSIVDVIALEGDLLSVKYKDVVIKSQLVGDYNIYNIRAAIAVGEYFGVSLEDIKSAIEEYVPSNSRSQLVVKGSCRIVVDAYNANPSSMELSIKNFDTIKADEKVLVIGDMKELGTYSLEEHIGVLKSIEAMKSTNVDLYFVGQEFQGALTKYKLSKKYEWFRDAASLAERINDENFDNKVILVKGSNSMRLSSLLECF